MNLKKIPEIVGFSGICYIFATETYQYIKTYGFRK